MLGTAGGTAVGYRVQADRPPTPLPPLNQPDLAYPAEPLPRGERPAPPSAAEDSRVKTDGDLRALLLPKPAGARNVDAGWLRDGWSDTTTHARGHDYPAEAFERLVQGDLRRIAGVAWQRAGGGETHIELMQFHSGAAAMTEAEQKREDIPGDGAPLRGSGNGRYHVYGPDEHGSGPDVRARAVAQRGDIVIDITLRGGGRAGPAEIRSLAERQLERLS